MDIQISNNSKPIAGYAIKFVMRNYSQNSNNYFENMLGETANIRSNQIPYFQIFIIFEKVPYYKNKREFLKYDVISHHHLQKYIALSKDNPSAFYHTPDKTLIILLKLKEKPNHKFKNSKEYAQYYNNIIDCDKLITYSTKIKDIFDNSVILNDYADFIKRTFYIACGRSK